jgi:hypothetical protein
MMGAMG